MELRQHFSGALQTAVWTDDHINKTSVRIPIIQSKPYSQWRSIVNRTSEPLLLATVDEEGSLIKPISPQEPPGRPFVVHNCVAHLQNNYSRLSSSVPPFSQALSFYTPYSSKHHHLSSTVSSEEINDAESAHINSSSNCFVTSNLYEEKDGSTECFLCNKIAEELVCKSSGDLRQSATAYWTEDHINKSLAKNPIVSSKPY